MTILTLRWNGRGRRFNLFRSPTPSFHSSTSSRSCQGKESKIISIEIDGGYGAAAHKGKHAHTASTKPSLTIAHEMVPHLKDLLEKTPPESTNVSNDRAARATLKEKEKTWLAWTLKKVETALNNEGADSAWLTSWRDRSGNALYVS